MSKLFDFDNKLRKDNNIKIIAGFDEAGRGPLAGPVFASGVILKPNYNNDLINDSKTLTSKQREELFNQIIENSLAYEITSLDATIIDKINILEASRKAMTICLNNLLKRIKIDLILTDYMKLNTDIKLISLKKGDQTSINIASSSILAKVSRDRYMIELSKIYPQYHFEKNKGYGTKEHIEAIKKYGYIKGIHRISFEPTKSIIKKEKEIKLF